MKKIISVVLVTVILLASAAYALADSNFPVKPVNCIVGWKPGGGSDMITRVVANSFRKYAGDQPMIVTNIEGAAGVQGIAEFMGYPQDGYTILSWATAQTIKAHMQVVAYNTLDFVPLGSFTLDSPYLLVRKDSPFQTLKDLIDYAKANPGALTIANAGAGGGIHLAALQLCMSAGIEANHIPYSGGAGAAQGLASGEVDCSMNMPPEGLPLIDSGDLRILCITSRERSRFYPDVPTAIESGFDFFNEQYRGFVVTKDVPQEAVDALQNIFKQIAEDEEFKKAVADINMNAYFLDGEGYAQALKNEDALYQQLIQSSGLGDRYK